MKEQNLDKQTDQLMAEMQFLSLGDVIPLNLFVNLDQLNEELEAYKERWIDFLPRKDRFNNRQTLSLFGLPDAKLNDGVSGWEARKRMGRQVEEMEFNTPTDLYRDCKSLHSLFEYFSPVGRSFFVKSNIGGWFYPHRDHPKLFRQTFRILVFCKNSCEGKYDWFLDGRKIDIEEGRAYYINTRLVHKTISYVDDSIHLIMNIPVTFANSQKIVNALQFSNKNFPKNPLQEKEFNKEVEIEGPEDIYSTT